MQAPGKSSGPQRLLFVIRYVVPGAIIVGGAVLAAADPSNVEGGFGIIGAGLAIALLSLFFRIGASGERDRDAEEEARAYYDEHGEWPSEPQRHRRWNLPEGVVMPEDEHAHDSH